MDKIEEENDDRRWLDELARDGSAIRTVGNRVDLFFEGDSTYRSMLADIAAGQKYIHLEMYMFLSDRIGRRIAEALSARARAGLIVRVVYDAIGSSEADPEMFSSMTTAGVQVEIFRPVAFWRKRSGILGRNHRKNLIIDGHIAFTGGMNLGEIWSREFSGEKAWRDTHLRIEGPGAAACDHFFAEAWEKASGSPLPESQVDPAYKDHPGTSGCYIIGGSGLAKRRAIRRLYSKGFNAAQQDVAMTVPYFVPPKRVLDVMRARSLRGVDVDVLVPRDSDVGLADWLREGLYPSLMDDGVEFREYLGSVLHAKSLLIDGRVAIIGSANFDYLSISLNWELAVVIDDPEVVKQLRGQYRLDLQQSEKVTWDWAKSRPLWRRIFAWVGAAIIRKL